MGNPLKEKFDPQPIVQYFLETSSHNVYGKMYSKVEIVIENYLVSAVSHWPRCCIVDLEDIAYNFSGMDNPSWPALLAVAWRQEREQQGRE